LKNMVRDGEHSDVNLMVADANKRRLLRFVSKYRNAASHKEARRVECSRVLKRNGEAWIYEFSYDADCEGFSRRLKRPCFLLKILAALHGLPRSTFKRGYIKEALEKSNCKNLVNYDEIITKLILYKT